MKAGGGERRSLPVPTSCPAIHSKNVPTQALVAKGASTIGLSVYGTKIENLVPGGPAHLSQRLAKDDVILAVDGFQVDSSTVVDHLQGSDAIGSKVLLTVRKNVSGDYVNVELVRVPMLTIENLVRVFQTLTLLKQNGHNNEEYERKSYPEGRALTCELLDELVSLISQLQLQNYDDKMTMNRNFTNLSEDLRSQLAVTHEKIHRLRARVDDGKVTVLEQYRRLPAEHEELKQKILAQNHELQLHLKEGKVVGQELAATEIQDGQLQQHLADEVNKCKALRDQLDKMEVKLAETEKNCEQIMVLSIQKQLDAMKTDLSKVHEEKNTLTELQKVGHLQQQLTDEENKGKALLDQLEKVESKLVDNEEHREELAAQLQKVSCERAATQLQVGQLQQQLTDEANKGKALLDQLEKMEAKLADTEMNREQLMVHLQVAAKLQKDKQLAAGSGHFHLLGRDMPTTAGSGKANLLGRDMPTTFDVRRAVELTRLAQELVAKEHLSDHKSILRVNSESDHVTTLGIMFDQKTHIISNMLVGGPASNSKNIFKGDTIVSIDGNDLPDGNIQDMLVGTDKPDSVITLGMKRSRTGKVDEVKLRRMAIRRLADKTRMFELLTKLSNCTKFDLFQPKDRDAERHVQEVIELWTAEMHGEAEHDELVHHNLREMQEKCDAWFKELLQILEGSVGGICNELCEVVQLQHQLAEETNIGKALLDQLQKMEARLADTEQLAASKLLAQSHELQLQLKEGKILGEVKVAAELQLVQLQQQLADEASKGKVLRDQWLDQQKELLQVSRELQVKEAACNTAELQIGQLQQQLAEKARKGKLQVGHLQQQLTDEENKGKALLDQLEKVESKLVDNEKDNEKHREELAAQLQKVSCERAATQLQVGQLQQQLTDEANKGKALLDQLEKMEAKLADSEINREQLMVHLQVAAQLQKDKQLAASTFDVRRAVELTRLAQELVAKEHLSDHKSILRVNSESDHVTTLGIMFDQKTHIISNMLVGGPASNSKNIFKGDTIVSIDGNDLPDGNIQDMLVGTDKPDSVITLGLKRSRTGKVDEVKLRRMAIRRLADKTRMFELLTKLSNCTKFDLFQPKDRDAERHVQEVIELWTAEMHGEAEHDELVHHNLREMQEKCDAWFKELLQILEVGVVVMAILKSGHSNFYQVGQLQQQVAEETNNGNALLDQLEKMETQRADTEKNRELLEAPLQKDRNERTAARDIISEVDLQKLCAQLAKAIVDLQGANAEIAEKVRQLQQQLAEEVNKGNALRDQLEKMDNVKDFEEALVQERKKSDVLTQRMHELETFISDLLVQQEEEEAKLEGTEKSRELLEAQLQHMLLQVSCELQAKAAAELQVGQLQQQLAVEANNGEALRDQLETMEAKLAYAEKKHDEYLMFTELEVRQLQQQLEDKGNILRDQLEKMEAKLSDTEEYREQHAAQLQKVRQLQQQLAEEVNKGNALRDQLEKMDSVKDFEEALVQERKKSDVLTQRMHELETFISDLLVQQEEEEAKLEGTEKSRELLEAQLQHMLLQVGQLQQQLAEEENKGKALLDQLKKMEDQLQKVESKLADTEELLTRLEIADPQADIAQYLSLGAQAQLGAMGGGDDDSGRKRGNREKSKFNLAVKNFYLHEANQCVLSCDLVRLPRPPSLAMCDNLQEEDNEVSGGGGERERRQRRPTIFESQSVANKVKYLWDPLGAHHNVVQQGENTGEPPSMRRPGSLPALELSELVVLPLLRDSAQALSESLKMQAKALRR